MGNKKNRNPDGTLKAGHGGLKRKGCSHRYTEFKKMAKSREPEILEKLFELALDGHSTALSFVANKMYGSAPLPDGIGLDGASTSEQITNLNERIKSGEVSSADIFPLIDLVKVNQIAVEITELKAMVKEITDNK